MSPQFTPARSDAIRAGLIEHVGRDTNRGHAPNPSSVPGSTVLRVARPRGPRLSAVFAGLVALVLVGGVTGVAVTAALNSQLEVATAPAPTTADAHVWGSGSVIERDGEVMLCLEGQEQSLPPWCAGAVAVLEGWEWGSIPHREVNGVRFTEESVTVRGALREALPSGDTRILVLTEPASSGRLVPAAAPAVGPAPSGLSDAELDAILREDLTDTIGPGTLSVVDGVIVARVAYDDGTLQSVVDREYGRGVFHIVPLLQPQ